MEDMTQAVQAAVKELFNVDVAAELTRPDEQFGDYATNVALQLAKQLGKNPREIGEALAAHLRQKLGEQVKTITVAGPGFLNLTLSDAALGLQAAAAPRTKLTSYAGKNMVVEYSDPNPFKVLHAGHIYTTVVGDAIAKLYAAAGATVHPVNYGGDVGRHVGATMWAILQTLGGENPAKLADVPEAERAEWMAANYVKGNTAFETDEAAKAAIVALNKQIYQLQADNDHNSPLAQIYWKCREWSYESFDAFYAQFGTKIEKYYPESAVSAAGLKAVREHVGAVFEESDGAVVFKGDRYGLHTRVFINSEGLPTYEAKEVGLLAQKYEDYHFDISVIITGNEQQQYMAVVVKALEQFWPDLAKASVYIPHGMLRLAGNTKMSSRKGNIVRATEVLKMTAAAIEATGRPAHDDTVLGAIRYSFLKNRISNNTIYDPDESVSLEGNSGPYLQYAHARARSVLRKAGNKPGDLADLDTDERNLARKIGEYPEVLEKAVAELMPHHICTYLYELAQSFNRFYEHAKVVGDPREATRLRLVELYADVLKDGLNLLGIVAPDKM